MGQRTPRAGAKGGFTYAPQLATLVDSPPSGTGWVHELKYDGYRIGASLNKGRIVLESRNGKDWTSAFPELVDALKQLKLPDALLDGEATIVDANGLTNFQALQNSFAGGKRQGVTYFVFDLLRLDGQDLKDVALEVRKSRLRELIPVHGPIRYSEHLEGDGAAILAAACKIGAEGIISKRRDRPHRAGRHDDWRKIKCSRRQEFVVGGFTDPEGSRAGFGALLLGYYEGEKLVFAGKVGTGKGFTVSFLSKLRAQLEPLEQPQSPYAVAPPPRFRKGAHWLKPVKVVQVSFAEWTTEGHLRHPSFLGLRDDKDAKTVVREKEREE